MKVILFGAGGAMGKKVAALQATRQNFEIVASVSQEFISDEEKINTKLLFMVLITMM